MRVVCLVGNLVSLASVTWRRLDRALKGHVRLRLTEEVVSTVHLLDGLECVGVSNVLLSGCQEVLLSLVVGDRGRGDRRDVGVLLATGLLLLAEVGGVQVLVFAESLPAYILIMVLVTELA